MEASRAAGDGEFCRCCWAGEGRGWRCVGDSRVGGRIVCVGVGGGGFSRIDQALEEADCATFEDEGTITLLGSVSSRRGSQTTRGKAL